MRALHAIGLCLFGAAGCASGDFVEAPAGSPPPATTGPSEAPAPATAAVCKVDAWTTVVGAADGAQLAIAPMPAGAVVLSVPGDGGALTGFAFDGYDLPVGDPAGRTIRPGPYASVRAGLVDGRLVAALGVGGIGLRGVGAGSQELDAVAIDLASASPLATAEGAFVAHAPVVHVDGARVLVTASGTGLALGAFDDQWTETATLPWQDAPIVGMDAVELTGDSANSAVAIATPAGCELARILGASEDAEIAGCTAPRIAATTPGDALMVFEHAGQIATAPLHSPKAVTILPEAGTSPRVAYDGERAWIAYLDGRGFVIAGYVDRDGAFHGHHLDEQPGAGSYELAIVDGAPWIYVVRAEGYFAYQLCREPE